jgi:hypothetical protein
MLKNRTNAYLKRQMITYGNSFESFLNIINKHIEGVYFDDLVFRKHTKDSSNYFFFAIKINEQDLGFPDSKFLLFLKHIRKSSFFITDYPLFLYKKHVVVFKSKEEFKNAFDRFRESKYSEMYSKDQLKVLKFPKLNQGEVSHTYCVLYRSKERLDKLKEIFKVRFNMSDVDVDTIDLQNLKEYDLPFKKEDEILNYEIT